MRNYFTMLLISQGVPFISHGDEFARTQRGNNNAYCQDNDISWVDWSLTRKNAGLVRFVRLMIALAEEPFRPEPRAIRQSRELARRQGRRSGLDRRDRARWRSICTAGTAQPDLYVIFNAHWESQRFRPAADGGRWRWKRLVDTNLSSPDDIVEEQHAMLAATGRSLHHVVAVGGDPDRLN